VRGSAKAGKKRTGAGVVALLVVAVVWWIVQEWRARHPADGSLAPGRPEEFVRTPEQARAAAPEDVPTEGGYERYDGCRLIAHRNNDGDSFHVKLPDGREAEFRLYFVDTPESQRKSYGGGETNEVRIGHQARYFGISPDRSVELGAEAKKRVIKMLAGTPFTVFTSWQPVYRSGRFFAFLRLENGAFLHQWLVGEGLARIYTEGAAMPDGTSADDREKELKKLEAEAKRQGAGGWGR
jgi:endonuclease YncB( thermonuclease family)